MTNFWMNLKDNYDHTRCVCVCVGGIGVTIMKMIYSSFKNVSPFQQEYNTEP